MTGGSEEVRIDVSAAEDFLDAGTIDALAPAVTAAAAELEAGTAPGSDFLGWLDLPEALTADDLEPVEQVAARARQDCEVYVVIGIGGSYLGARAVLEALGAGRGETGGPEILFAGTNLCSAALSDLLARVQGREMRLCVISKSGTTLEPAVAFRFLRALMRERYGRDAARRITAVTDASRGALRRLAGEEGYETFVIPDDVGGRFSVLTPVGLLPLAVAGVDIRSLVAGAARLRIRCLLPELRDNPAHLYAAARHALHRQGFRTEVLSTFCSRLGGVQEWWKQLFGESEGKDGKGIFPASVLFTTDLHSLGQYLQDGPRDLMETFLSVRNSVPDLAVPAEPGGGADPDGLDYLVGTAVDEINRQAFAGTRNAHLAGGVPCLTIEVDSLTERTVGGLIYLFEKAVAVSGRLLGVNPFDQPGVEAYKQEMFRLLERPQG